jgi:hypothetical protein
MAREGYLILDSDLHMMEPDDLWVRYLDEPYRSSNPPRFFGGQLQNLADVADSSRRRAPARRHRAGRRPTTLPAASTRASPAALTITSTC